MFAAAMPIAGVAFAADEPKDLLKPSNPTAGPDRFKGLKVGVASYTFRKVTLEQTIKAIQRVGLHYVSIKDFHLPMKSTAEEPQGGRKGVRRRGDYAAVLRQRETDDRRSRQPQCFRIRPRHRREVMVCAPDPAALPMLEKLVKEFDIKLAIHNHGPEDKIFPSPYEVQKAVEKLDPRIGYCIDVGHTARAGHDPAKAMRDLKDRLYDVHFKDVADLKGKSRQVGD